MFLPRAFQCLLPVSRVSFGRFCAALILPLLGGASAFGQINDISDLRQLLTQGGDTAVKSGTGGQPGASPASTNPNIFYAAPGPWGKLRCAYIYLEAPKTLVDNF
ncbi:MAG TPA: hypothetical protein VGE29_22685, partial [Prosthecobacter sp.]